MQADIPDALKSKTYGAVLEALLLEHDLLPLGLFRQDTDGRLSFVGVSPPLSVFLAWRVARDT